MVRFKYYIDLWTAPKGRNDIWTKPFLASQDALEVMRVTESLSHLLTEWALALTLLM